MKINSDLVVLKHMKLLIIQDLTERDRKDGNLINLKRFMSMKLH